MLDDITDWESKVTFPVLEAVDWQKQADTDVHTNLMALVAGAGLVPFEDGHSIYDEEDKIRMCMVLNGMFERLHALMALMEKPEACETLFGAIADYKIAYFEKIAKYYDINVINAHDDYGTNSSLFMSPKVWHRLL